MASHAAIVLGATGAIGRHVVDELVRSERITRVTTLTRRNVPEWTSRSPLQPPPPPNSRSEGAAGCGGGYGGSRRSCRRV